MWCPLSWCPCPRSPCTCPAVPRTAVRYPSSRIMSPGPPASHALSSHCFSRMPTRVLNTAATARLRLLPRSPRSCHSRASRYRGSGTVSSLTLRRVSAAFGSVVGAVGVATACPRALLISSLTISYASRHRARTRARVRSRLPTSATQVSTPRTVLRSRRHHVACATATACVCRGPLRTFMIK